MSRNRPMSPSITGVRPTMNAMFTGRNIAVRPIPVQIDVSEARAIASAASDQQPKTSVVNMPSKPRPTAADTIFGTPVARSAQVNGAVYDPSAGIEHIV